MRSSSLRATQVLLCCAIGADALPELAIVKHRHADFNPARLKRRQDSDTGGTVETNTYDVLTWSTGGAYYANVTVGTPPQEQVVILDTGSSDLYFDSSTAPVCQTTGRFSCRGGTFDTSSSSSYNVLAESPAFNTSFGDGSTAVGPFAEDTVGVGDVSIEGVQFGVGEDVNSTTGFAIGLMGLGYSQIEASQRLYPNIPEVLALSGEIDSRLYSVYLNDIDATSGSILFGGIDKSKFSPPLVTLNLLPTPNVETVLQFITTVTALNATVSDHETEVWSGGTDSVGAYGNSDTSLAVLLDTGSSAWSLPGEYYDAVLNEFSYVNPRDLTCDCKYRDSKDSIAVTFGGEITINVPARQFIVPVFDPLTNEPQYFDSDKKDPICIFMLAPADTVAGDLPYQPLGDAVLRSMYIVYDLDNGQVSIAQASLDTDAQPDIVRVSSGPDGVASALEASSSVVSTAPSNTYSIAPAVSGGESFSASTIGSTVGVATGTDAVPGDARASETASEGAASSSAAAVRGATLGGGMGKEVFGLAGLIVVCMSLGGGILVL